MKLVYSIILFGSIFSSSMYANTLKEINNSTDTIAMVDTTSEINNTPTNDAKYIALKDSLTIVINDKNDTIEKLTKLFSGKHSYKLLLTLPTRVTFVESDVKGNLEVIELLKLKEKYPELNSYYDILQNYEKYLDEMATCVKYIYDIYVNSRYTADTQTLKDIFESQFHKTSCYKDVYGNIKVKDDNNDKMPYIVKRIEKLYNIFSNKGHHIENDLSTIYKDLSKKILIERQQH